MKRSRFALVVGAAALAMSTLVACAADEEPPAETDEPAASAEVALATDEVGDFGEIVVDGSGRTVYIFDNDTADPPKSNCEGDCATAWPPVEAPSGEPELDGVDASLVGTVERPDGTQQLTLNGWPLYLFAKDTKPGDATGQAVNDVWWVVGPDGTKITKEQAPATTGGY